MKLTVGNRTIEAVMANEGPRDTRFGRMDCLQLLMEQAPSPSEIKALTEHPIHTDDDRVFTGYGALDSVSVLLYRPTDEAELRREIKHKDAALREVAALLPDEVAIQHPELFPGMRFDGQEIKVGTRINWHGVLMRATKPNIDNPDCTPAVRPELWEKVPGQDKEA